MYHISKAGVWPPIYLPLYLERISAGFPSPAQDYVEQRLDLNKLCVKRPADQQLPILFVFLVIR